MSRKRKRSEYEHSRFLALPAELHLFIVSFLDLKTHLACMSTCKELVALERKGNTLTRITCVRHLPSLVRNSISVKTLLLDLHSTAEWNQVEQLLRVYPPRQCQRLRIAFFCHWSAEVTLEMFRPMVTTLALLPPTCCIELLLHNNAWFTKEMLHMCLLIKTLKLDVVNCRQIWARDKQEFNRIKGTRAIFFDQQCRTRYLY
jgi:hypothetical protein